VFVLEPGLPQVQIQQAKFPQGDTPGSLQDHREQLRQLIA
jgi:hypothetical protein